MSYKVFCQDKIHVDLVGTSLDDLFMHNIDHRLSVSATGVDFNLEFQ